MKKEMCTEVNKMKFKIKFNLRALGEIMINAENEEDAEEKLLAKDAIEIVELMNILESDVDTIKVEEVDY